MVNLLQNFRTTRRRAALAILAAAVLLALPAKCLAAPALADDCRTVPSQILGRSLDVCVVLPAGYNSSAPRRYPVLFYLHGLFENEHSWIDRGGQEILEGLLSSGKVGEFIVVLPDAGKSFYVNSYDGRDRYEDFFIQELVPWVDRTYRALARRETRGIEGDSMGGYGSMMLGLKYANLFSAVASLSGTLRCAEWDPVKMKDATLREAFGPLDNPARAAVDPFKLIKKVPRAQMPQLYFSIGEGDSRVMLGDNRAFAHLLAQLKIPYRYCEVPGGHQWPVWELEIQRVLALQAPVLGVKVAGCPGVEKMPDGIQAP